MPQIDLQAYWGPTSFNLDCEQLRALRDYLATGQTGVVTIGAWNFKWQAGGLYFANSGNPEKYYIDMTSSAIIAVIDAAIAQHC
ncbi:hypothetical protein [Pseudomonas fluorescens]|uniref:hypothetical protein n=1 Tax=Pseudomonas fluorescens TaxID=294 RepID=UPI001242B0FF|nr:hypothetical protein [Pseudomonas fluorescens]VVO47589.1 hypothetical protein PS898_00109 [Pseudomonas fluorescens]